MSVKNIYTADAALVGYIDPAQLDYFMKLEATSNTAAIIKAELDRASDNIYRAIVGSVDLPPLRRSYAEDAALLWETLHGSRGRGMK